MRIDIFEATTSEGPCVVAVERTGGRAWDITTGCDGEGLAILNAITNRNLGDLQMRELPDGAGALLCDPDTVHLIHHSGYGTRMVGNIFGTRTDDLFLSESCDVCADEGWVVRATVLWYSHEDEHHYHLCWDDLKQKKVTGGYTLLADTDT